ncbi:MAG: DEAD/DEAH box helicase, partial [Halobacteria archaeon]|nr:DEAD/DEAH box helicase [Halobacteria archaeon]
MSDTRSSAPSFSDLKLPTSLLTVLDEVGYETPTPIQAQAIPPLLEGLDLLGHAPTGTGKTAAFALPLLSRLEIGRQQVQVMVLTPTRELAIQVAEAFQHYASHIRGFHVLPVYGGQDYAGQIRQLKRGVHVVVGTPGRVMDHMRKGKLKLDALQALVLDEADEMLRMGFIDDVEWILEQTPKQRQMALFSATMPKQIQRIARRHLRDPREIAIK